MAPIQVHTFRWKEKGKKNRLLDQAYSFRSDVIDMKRKKEKEREKERK